MKKIFNKIAQLFYKLAYRAILLFWFFTRPTVYGVYVAVWHKEKLLVIKNSYKKRITIPCGHVKRGEDKAEAAVRELYEEVSIKLDNDQLDFVGEYKGEFRYATDIGTFFEILMAELPQIQVDNREVVWAQFMPLDQVANLNLNPTVKAWLKNRPKNTDRQLPLRSAQ
jgi:8-oxo-dGTP pyrophosphatase MutT (NUDIX family)